LGSSPYGPDAPSPYRQALCVPYLISAQDSPVPVPKFQMASRLKTLMSCGSKKGTWIYYPFFPKSPDKRKPSGFPSGTPRDRYPLAGCFYISLNISLTFCLSFPGKGSPSMFLNRVPLDRDTPIIRAIGQVRGFYLFIYSCMSAGSPQKRALLHTYRKDIRSPSTELHADRRPTYIGVQTGFPRGSLMTLLSVPRCHAAFGMIPQEEAQFLLSLIQT